MNKQEDRPIAVLKINTQKHPGAVKEIAAWLRKQADYIVKHETENSQHLRLRLFKND
jgi:formyltetrahydrofolate hydrolase